MDTGEENAKQTFVLMKNGANFVFNKLVVDFLREQKQSTNTTTENTGKIQLKELMKQGQTVTNIEVKDKNLRSFEKYARKYGITFSAIKTVEEGKEPVFNVFFKAKDQDVITQAFLEYSKDKIKSVTEQGADKNETSKKKWTLEKFHEKVYEKREEQKILDKDLIKNKKREQEL